MSSWTPAPNDPAVIALHAANGPDLFGMFFHWGLLGVIVCQVQTYHRCYHHRDQFLIRALVYALLTFEIMFTAFLSHFAFQVFVKSWESPELLLNLPWSAALITPSGGIVACIVQLFFAWRCWMLTKSGSGWKTGRFVTVVIVMLALFQFSGTMIFTIKWAVKYNLDLFVIREDRVLVTSAYVWLVGTFATDVLIAGTMVTLLYRAHAAARHVRSTENIVGRLIFTAVGTGVVTTVVCLIDIFLYFHPSMRDKNYHAALALSFGKLYTATLMANLNGRTHFEGVQMIRMGNDPDSMELSAHHASDSSRIRASQGIIVSTTIDHTDDQGNSKDIGVKRLDF